MVVKINVNKVTNKEVLSRLDEYQSIMKSIWGRKADWIGHILRHDCLQKTIIEEKRGRGKGWECWMA